MIRRLGAMVVAAQGRMVFTERQSFRVHADMTSVIREHLGVTS